MLISDIHLRDYHRFNKFPHQRLYSFVELAKDIVKIGKDNDIDTLLIGGDLVDKNTLSPLELHTLFAMFTILAKQFRIHSIIGNHDAKSKKDIVASDTVITLLEEIKGITFHHREILTIGGKTIAFENWVPEYDLSWIKEPVDLYMSHATIDYDNNGFYGMDTSVFEGKFKFGVFGDIHVTRQVGNLISIGNTKQESLSDRYQGGVMIMDLDDMSYKRIPIDPEHKKYLHLTTTEEEDEEGWEDLEGSSMVYRIYKPKEVKGKVRTFKVPQITDIEARTTAVMNSTGLLDLHKKIKSESTYSPIDFNFKVKELHIENFRSIRQFNWDLTSDYIVTGPNGSGKSSIMTALFYALIGKKTLKKDIKIGQKFCRLKVKLDYQGVEYKIVRGTDAGDFELWVGKSNLKFNTKLEFEKAVFSYLPFLYYHESFFFNSWDNELLGAMKVDKRYDLLAKYYRLDSLSSYNDTALAALKVKKKELKDLESEAVYLENLKKTRESDVLELETNLQKSISEKELDVILKEHSEVSNLINNLNTINSKCYDYQSKIDSNIEKINSKRLLLSSLKKTLVTEKTKEEIETRLRLKEQHDALAKRISDGEKYLDSLELNKTSYSNRVEVINEKLKNLGDSVLQELPEDLESRIDSLNSKIEKLKINKSNSYSNVNFKIKESQDKLLKLEEEYKEIESRERDHENCDCCGQIVTKEFLLSSLQKDRDNEYANLKGFNKTLNTLNATYKNYAEDLKALETQKDELKKVYHSILNSRVEFEKNKQERLSLTKEKEDKELLVTECNKNLSHYTGLLNSLKGDLLKLPNISLEETISLNSDLRNLSLIEKTESDLENLKVELKPEIDSDKKTLALLEEQRDSIQKSLDKKDILSEIEVRSYKELKYKYSTLEEFKKKMDDSRNLYNVKSIAVEKLSIEVNELEQYEELTSRSGPILKGILEDLTKTFSSSRFKFSTAKVQSTGKIVTDMSIDLLVDKKWIPYDTLSTGQKTLCDLYYLSKVITGVGIVSFDETLRFVDDENLKLCANLIDDIKKNGLVLSSHSSNLSMEGTKTLECQLNQNTSVYTIVV